MTLRQRMRECPYFKAFMEQHGNALRRGIAWEFTFEEWKAVWDASGYWPKRGKGHGRYVMARHGDAGPYSVSNVKIIPNQENIREALKGKPANNPWGRRGKPQEAVA